MASQRTHDLMKTFNTLDEVEKLEFVGATLRWLEHCMECAMLQNPCGHESCKVKYALGTIIIGQACGLVEAELAFVQGENEPHKPPFSQRKPEQN